MISPAGKPIGGFSARPVVGARRSGQDWRVAASVLIVDDHAGFRALARRLLESAGYEVVGEAADGAAALAAVADLRPAVVLLDVQLPDVDGFAVSRRLAAEDDPPVVVLISSRDRSAYRRRLADAPARGFLAKSELSGPALTALLG
jgi:DNA-binding NarL/FixJ family response regulator